MKHESIIDDPDSSWDTDPVKGGSRISRVGAPLPPSMKTGSAFYPPELVERARQNAETHDWAAAIRDAILAKARPWLEYSHHQLWEMIFGPGITRSWMVWSDGHCPACMNPVTMYNWEIDPFGAPWKVGCPHCAEVFPKNDFEVYYRSGLDRAGIFRAEGADRTLLVAEEQNPSRPVGFGIDDGEGYVEGDCRWRFIGAFLVYGQWKGLILGGIDALSAAYIVSGDDEYGRRAAILLDRVADLYPLFDFAEQGLVYEVRPRSGFVSNWHDSCVETRMLVEAYDRVFPVFEDDSLRKFLQEKAARAGLLNTKNKAFEIRRNVEERILRETLANRDKIYANFPNEEQTCLTIEAVLEWPDNRARIEAMIDEIVAEGTSVDGMTGEKGLMGYATIGPRQMVGLLGMFARLDPGFLAGTLERHPRLCDHFRFHIDTWCLHRFYPKEGDGGGFNQETADYFEMLFNKRGFLEPGLLPSPYSFLGELHRLTGNDSFAQVIYTGNGGHAEGLPHDLFADDPPAFQARIESVVREHGDLPAVSSVNKEQWHLAILRSGEGANARAAWIDYDAEGRHCHHDAMNIGLFARGLDLLPDLGYPPVQYGGWFSEKAEWYKSSAAHNTVVIDGRNSEEGAGRTDLWIDAGEVQAIRVSAPGIVRAERFERTVALVDVSAEDAYVLDVFRVKGGCDHACFLHGFAGELTTHGLNLKPISDYGHDTVMRDFKADPEPEPAWNADWRIDEKRAGIPGGADVHLRYHGLTEGASACTAESWVSLGYSKENPELWIPQLMMRRQGPDPLDSLFVGVLEPYAREPFINGTRRIDLEGAGDGAVAVEVKLSDGRTDLLVVSDSGGSLTIAEWDLLLDGVFCWVRCGIDGAIQRVTVAGGWVSVGGITVKAEDRPFIARCF